MSLILEGLNRVQLELELDLATRYGGQNGSGSMFELM
jgi:hypothetical protein